MQRKKGKLTRYCIKEKTPENTKHYRGLALDIILKEFTPNTTVMIKYHKNQGDLTNFTILKTKTSDHQNYNTQQIHSRT